MYMSLSDILSKGLIKVGDSVEFTFKDNHFVARICKGGIISDCKVRRAGMTVYEKVLQSVLSFGSLTAWTEACLQEVLEEYYTRYSSWKRVTHYETKMSMSEIRDRCKLMDLKREDTVELYKEIRRLELIVEDMKGVILGMGGKIDRRWQILPVSNIEHEPVLKRKRLTHPDAFTKIQDIILHT